jgi:hypothetical protein
MRKRTLISFNNTGESSSPHLQFGLQREATISENWEYTIRCPAVRTRKYFQMKKDIAFQLGFGAGGILEDCQHLIGHFPWNKLELVEWLKTWHMKIKGKLFFSGLFVEEKECFYIMQQGSQTWSFKAILKPDIVKNKRLEGQTPTPLTGNEKNAMWYMSLIWVDNFNLIYSPITCLNLNLSYNDCQNLQWRLGLVWFLRMESAVWHQETGNDYSHPSQTPGGNVAR